MANETLNFNIGGIDHPVKDPNAYVKPSTGIPKEHLSQEVQDVLDGAGSGDGTVTGVKVGNTTYEPTEGVVDISQAIPDVSGKANKSEMSVVDGTGANADKTTITLKTGTSATVLKQHQDISGKVDKVTGYGLSKNDYTDADKTKLANIEDGAEVNVINGINKSDNTPLTPDQNGIVTLPSASAGGNVSVIQPDPAGGTFIIRVGDTDYTINLNHQHPEYAPLVHTHSQYVQVQVVNGESNLPDLLDPKTIYGVKAGGVDELEMVVIGGYKFYGGGGTPGQPVLMQPAIGSSVSMGIVDNGPLDNVLDPKSKLVYIKARNITQPINVSVSGTGFSIENSVSQISAADASTGVNINVLFDGSASSQGGTLVLQSTELGSAYIDLTVEYVPYEVLDAVGLRGTQWIETDYLVNSNTNLKAVWQFTPNSNTRQMGTKNYIIDSKIDHTTSVFMVYFGNNASENNAGTYMLNVATDGKVSYNSYYQQLRFNTNNNPDATFCNKGTFVYSGTSASFNGKSITMVRQTRTANNGMRIGIKDVDGETPVNAFDIDIYSIEITEGETTVRNYIPVTKNGVAGLYDTVNGAFHASASGTPLVEVTSNNS